MKIQIYIVLATLLTLFRSVGFAMPAYDDNPNIRQVHLYLYDLRFATADKLLKDEEQKNPGNGYVTFYRLYSKVIGLTISNSPEQYTQSLPEIKMLIRKLGDLPDNAPDYRYLLGEAKVFSGLLNIKYNSKTGGLLECLRGYNLLKDNDKKYPLFRPDDKIPGMIQIGVAFMPKILKWGIKILGIKSNPQEGLKKVTAFSAFARGKTGYEEEAFLLTMAACKLMNQEEEALTLIREKGMDFKGTVLLNYIAASICLDANEAESALYLLSKINPEKPEVAFPSLHYLTGKAKLLRLDPDAYIPLINFIGTTTGADYLKASLYDLACFYLVTGNTSEYRKYIAQVNSKGRELHNRDIEAAFEVHKPGAPNIQLLRAQLLVRGGYFKKSEDELSKIRDINRLSENDKVQFFYLNGECKRLQNLVGPAESDYMKAFNTGSMAGDYVAQQALVKSGIMMEKNGNKSQAKKYYNLCLHFNAVSNPYSELYNNKAKAGLIRLSLLE